jgi:hypothetical protein
MMQIRLLRGADPLVRSRPPGRLLSMRIPHCVRNYSGMTFYRRRLPHIYETDQPVFLTWRLHDSLPSNRTFPAAALNSGQAFAAIDRLLDQARSGRFTCANRPSQK